MRNKVIPLKVPWLSENEVRVEVVSWLVAASDRVEIDQDLLELLVDGEQFILPSPLDGILLEVMVLPGDLLAPGEVVAEIEED